MCATIYSWRYLMKAMEVTAGLADSNDWVCGMIHFIAVFLAYVLYVCTCVCTSMTLKEQLKYVCSGCAMFLKTVNLIA